MDKIKMFEMMQKLNKDFPITETGGSTISNMTNNLTSQAIDKVQNVNYDQSGNYRLSTYGDLKKAINVIKMKQKGSKIANVGVDNIVNAIPFIGNAKTVYDLVRAAVNKPDNKKTNTWLDKLDVDDDMSKIIDDNVENGFLEYIVKKIEKTNDNIPLDPSFNMNDELSEYLKQTYQNRTVVGYK